MELNTTFLKRKDNLDKKVKTEFNLETFRFRIFIVFILSRSREGMMEAQRKWFIMFCFQDGEIAKGETFLDLTEEIWNWLKLAVNVVERSRCLRRF